MKHELPELTKLEVEVMFMTSSGDSLLAWLIWVYVVEYKPSQLRVCYHF